MTSLEWPSWKELKADLDAAGFRPSRRLGQNFMVDPSVARAIARDARVAEGDFVLEVGPGLGALSFQLLALRVKLLCVEVDGRLLELAREQLAGFGDAVRFLHTDVLASKHALAESVAAKLPQEGPWHLVANLPYSVSAPVLCVLRDLPNPPESMTVLVQREVALRIDARPDTSDWGPLSIRLQTHYEVERLRDVGPRVFWPQPEVESAVVRMVLRGARPEPEASRCLSILVDTCFQRRRQSLGRVLGEALGDREVARSMLAGEGVSPGSRAETLSLDELLAISAAPEWRERCSREKG